LNIHKKFRANRAFFSFLQNEKICRFKGKLFRNNISKKSHFELKWLYIFKEN